MDSPPSRITRLGAPVDHVEEDYDSDGFRTLLQMQRDHFWYRGRHRFVLRWAEATWARFGSPRSVIDLGSGCGGWIRYLEERHRGGIEEFALGDSSMKALTFAEGVVSDRTALFQINLLDLPWEGRWDTVFLLDVLEHLEDDEGALGQAMKAVRPGGLVIVTMPALDVFWSWNDEAAGHKRRYDRGQMASLAKATGMELVEARYFMWLLSPLLFLSRLGGPGRDASHAEVREAVRKGHRIPHPLVNESLAAVFGLESPLSRGMRFPWGTSILGIFRRPG